MKRLRLFALLCGFMMSTLSWAADTLRISGANDIRIIGYLKEYVDCSKAMVVDSVLMRWRQGDFSDVAPERTISRGVTSCQHWFSLTLHNTSDKAKDYLWNFYYDGIKFTLYEVDSALTGIVEEREMSHYTPMSEREVNLRSVSFRIPMQPDECKTFLLKTEVYGRQNLYFPTDISTERDILSYELGFSLLTGHYFGFFIFAIVFSLSLFIVLRSRFYAMMSGYLVSLLCFNILEYLHGSYLIPESLYPYWAMVPKIVWLAFTLYFNVYVFQSFTAQEKYLPNLNRLLSRFNRLVFFITWVFLGLYLYYFPSAEVLQIIQPLFAGLLLIQTLILLVNIGYAVFRRTPYILHYLIGNGLLFVSVLLYLLNTFDIMSLPLLFKPGNIIFAFAFESAYLMIVFAVKYKRDVDKFVRDLTIGEERRAKLTVELLTTQEKERQRIARDIHDGIGGTLQALRLMLSQEKLNAEKGINDTIKGLNDEFRHLVYQIAPKHLDSLGLFGVIERDATFYSPHPQITCYLEGDERLLPWDLKINVYRIYQELLTNALKHGQGLTTVDIQLLIDEDAVTILVENDYSTDLKRKGDTGNGVTNIRSRIAYYDGTYKVEEGENRYTVEISIPLQNKERKKHDSTSNH